MRSALANSKCTRDKKTRGCTAAKRHDFEKHAKRYHQPRETWILSWYSGDQLLNADRDVECTVCRDTLVQLLRRIAITSENQTRCSGDDRVWGEFFD